MQCRVPGAGDEEVVVRRVDDISSGFFVGGEDGLRARLEVDSASSI